jgi:hypothetical protein
MYVNGHIGLKAVFVWFTLPASVAEAIRIAIWPAGAQFPSILTACYLYEEQS